MIANNLYSNLLEGPRILELLYSPIVLFSEKTHLYFPYVYFIFYGLKMKILRENSGRPVDFATA